MRVFTGFFRLLIIQNLEKVNHQNIFRYSHKIFYVYLGKLENLNSPLFIR